MSINGEDGGVVSHSEVGLAEPEEEEEEEEVSHMKQNDLRSSHITQMT